MADEDVKTQAVELAKDGRWLVPVDRRPSNWQFMGLKEPLVEAQAEAETAIAVMEQPVSVEIKPAVTSVTANTTAELPGLQAPLIPWAKERLEDARAEHAELSESIEHAKKRKWKFTGMMNSARKALSRITFYEKIVAALEDGYMLFPPVPNAAVFAIRTEKVSQYGQRYTKNSSYPVETIEPEGLPVGEGQYVNPYVRWIHWDDKDIGGGNVERSWRPEDLDSPVFPLKMAKPRIVEAVNAAMEQGVFDEIRMFPMEKVSAPSPRLRAGAMSDPCILGAIYDPRNRKRHYFLISWLIEKSDV